MTMTKTPPLTAQELRQRAEELYRTSEALIPESTLPEETKQLFHELRVHQIELEMQNEELRCAQAELDASQARYFDLYDLAPVGYMTISENRMIREVNLATANMFNVSRNSLVKKPISRILPKEAQYIFYQHLNQCSTFSQQQQWEMRLVRDDGELFWARLQVTPAHSGEYWVAFIDITERITLELELQKAYNGLELMVTERTLELTAANMQLSLQIEERKLAEEPLQRSFTEIQQLKDRLRAENMYLQQEISQQFNFGEIVGQSNAMKHVFIRVEQVAPMDATVLLLGETGTGKGVIARAIHSRSVRKDQPMITVNCTSLPANLIESELFGREKGAFTGAHARQMGRFELADGGTIFLDEIGEMPLELQCKLLRVIQDGEFERLGSPLTIKVDVRIIAASNRNLEEEIRNGRFREDLFYRLNVFPITIPPLRQRSEDIPLLVNHFVAKFNKKIGKNIATVSKETLNALQKYSWPGNVRELESVIERAEIISQGSSLQVFDRFETFSKAGEAAEGDVKVLSLLEQNHILQVLQKTGWRIDGTKGAALLLGINPSTLRSRMKKYGIIRR
ncbi:MAG: sigma 54-interacting transcriptional regulator [Deltaproteobacteria bacterium]